MKNLIITSDEEFVKCEIHSNDQKFFTVGDLKKFLIDTNIPDDAKLQICYEASCESDPQTLFYDKKKKEFCVME